MVTVNSEIRRILKDKERMVRSGTESMIDLLKDLQSQVRDEIGRAALGSWDAYHLRQVMDSIEDHIAIFTNKAQARAGAILNDAWQGGQRVVEGPLSVGGVYSGFSISSSILETLKDFTFFKIEGLSDAAWQKIRGELSLGILGQKTPQDVANAIGKNLKDPGIFKSIAARAETITQTEMGRVFSAAAELRMEEAAHHIDGLEKEWLHAGHPKVPRDTHLAAHGQHVPVDEPFNIGGISMMFPRDPAAPIDEVINCG